MKYLKPALLYLVKIVLIFILTLFIYLPMQLIFKFSAPNLINSAEALLINGIICALAEIVLFFVVFKADFRDEKDADIKLFTISFVIALSLQLIIASINHFYIYTAGCGVSFIGQFIQASKTGVIPQTPNDVPISYYLISTAVADVLRYLAVFLAYIAAKRKQKREKEELFKK